MPPEISVAVMALVTDEPRATLFAPPVDTLKSNAAFATVTPTGVEVRVLFDVSTAIAVSV